ncbi:MAG: hypothetical protein AB1563_12145 [Bacillota bacterium]
MSRSLFLSALAATVFAFVSGPAAAESAAGYSCQQLPEIKKSFERFTGKQVDRDRVEWQIKQADRLCTEGKTEEAKGYLDLAHSMVLKDHKH